jgi:hypothetical protein
VHGCASGFFAPSKDTWLSPAQYAARRARQIAREGHRNGCVYVSGRSQVCVCANGGGDVEDCDSANPNVISLLQFSSSDVLQRFRNGSYRDSTDRT